MKPLSDSHSEQTPGIARPVLAGVFFISASVLAYQIALTRLFSIIMWHHHAYLVVSVALLGFGASGAVAAIRFNQNQGFSAMTRGLFPSALAFAAALPASYFMGSRLHIEAMQLLGDWKNFCTFLALLGLLAVPFFFAGYVIAVCFQAYSRQAGKLYGFDMLGAALGAAAAPLLLNAAGVNGAAMASAFLAGLAAVCLSAEKKAGKWAATVLTVLYLLAFLGFNSGRLFWEIPMDLSKQRLTIAYQEDPRLNKVYSLEIPFSGGRHLVYKRSVPDMRRREILHSAIAQLDIWPEHRMHMLGGGEFGLVDYQEVPMRMVTQDGIGPTFLYKDAGDLKKFPSLDDSQISSAYLALKTQGKTRPNVLVIGVGGGIDVMTALFHDAASVTAVEINPAMIRMVTQKYADYIGHLFSDPRVELINQDGRSFLDRSRDEYDVIQLTGVDTLTALSTGAYTLSENYLYTVEAIENMLDRLSENGMVCYSRPIFSLFGPPRETLRLAVTARTALERAGVKEPWRHIAILQANNWASTMIKKSPFTPEECAALAEFGRKEGFAGVVFAPYLEKGEEQFPLDAFARSRRLFHQALMSDGRELNRLLKESAFNLYPPSDDKPFFFNYYKISNVASWWGHGARGEMKTKFLPDFPAGHMILTAAVIQVSLLAALFILLPVWAWNKRGAPLEGKARTFVYFAALGLGFIFIEICLMQKLILFLGRPTYAVTVVLAGMLFFAGLGAWLSERFPPWTRKRLLTAGAGVLILCCFNAFFPDALTGLLTGLPLPLRMAAAWALIGPTGVVLGLFFPLGIRAAAEKSPPMIAWAWAVNGFFTVLGSVLAIMAAMSFGFSRVLMLAGLIYLIGAAFGLALNREAKSADG